MDPEFGSQFLDSHGSVLVLRYQCSDLRLCQAMLSPGLMSVSAVRPLTHIAWRHISEMLPDGIER